MEREWKNIESNPPKESGRYWCHVQHLNDLGTSHFQWNCYFDKEENRWSVDKLNDGEKPIYWTELLDSPQQIN